jgi:hypothetical protein
VRLVKTPWMQVYSKHLVAAASCFSSSLRLSDDTLQPVSARSVSRAARTNGEGNQHAYREALLILAPRDTELAGTCRSPSIRRAAVPSFEGGLSHDNQVRKGQ